MGWESWPAATIYSTTGMGKLASGRNSRCSCKTGKLASGLDPGEGDKAVGKLASCHNPRCNKGMGELASGHNPVSNY